MILFVSIFLIYSLLLIFRLDKKTAIISNNVLEFYAFLFLFFLVAFRYGIATDYWSYYKIFNTNSTFDIARLEKGFLFLQKCSKYISEDNFNLFVFIIAFLSLWTKYAIFKTYSNSLFAIFLYLTLHYIHIEFNVMRQGLAISLLLWAVEYGRKKKLFHYFIFVMSATFIHASSIIFIPLYPLCSKKFKVKKMYIGLIIIFALILKLSLLQNLLTVISVLLLKIFPSMALIQQVCVYLITGDFKISMGLLRRLIILFAYLFITDDREYTVYFIFYLIGIFFYTLFMGNDIFAYRLSLSFDFFGVPMFAQSRIHLSKKNIFLLLALIAFLFVIYVAPLDGYVIPYKTYLFGGM